MSAETIDSMGVEITRDEPREYRKIATVRAGPALRGGTMPTLEGPHTFEAGDYICGPGAGGEFWPVKRAIFEATYVPASEPVSTDGETPNAGMAITFIDPATGRPLPDGSPSTEPREQQIERIAAALTRILYGTSLAPTEAVPDLALTLAPRLYDHGLRASTEPPRP